MPMLAYARMPGNLKGVPVYIRAYVGFLVAGQFSCRMRNKPTPLPSELYSRHLALRLLLRLSLHCGGHYHPSVAGK